MTVKVDQDKCIGCGTCAAICDNFEMENGKAKVKDPEDTDKCNKDAVDACPVEAISIQ